MYKQAILVRQDLKMPKGKLAAQVAHASLESAYMALPEVVEAWRMDGAKKVVLKVKDRGELLLFIRKAKKADLPSSLIKDAGRTFFKLPTLTCGGIGPVKEEELDEIISELKLL